MNMTKEFILHRHPKNPIIRPADFPVPADSVMNCGQTLYNGKTLLLISVIYRGKPFGEVTGMHVATSEDGIHFDIEEKPFIMKQPDFPWPGQDEWVIDPRVTKIGDTYYIMRPAQGNLGPAAVLEKTTDWKNREFVDFVALPSNRVPCLFPEKINGLYCRLDRPFNPGGSGSIWLSYSPDLVYWGRHRPMMDPPGFGAFYTSKIGPTPPIKTKDGWLVIIHGAWESCADTRYSLGAILLDLEDPSQRIGRTNSWILTPDEPYELTGHVGNVVFSCGAIADLDKDEIRVYYGAADTCIGLAVGSLSELVDACKRGL